MSHRTDVSIRAWKPYIIWFYVRSIESCITISIRGFILIFFILCWYEKDISLLIFIAQNCQNVYWNHRKTSVFQDLFVIKFHFKMDYDIQRHITNNSLGSHEYRQLRQCWIIPSNLNYLYLIPPKFSNLNPYFLTSHLCFDSFWFSEYKSNQYLQQPAHPPILYSSINPQNISFVMVFEILYMLDFLRIFWRIKCATKN